jgi:hypothetical protein
LVAPCILTFAFRVAHGFVIETVKCWLRFPSWTIPAKVHAGAFPYCKAEPFNHQKQATSFKSASTLCEQKVNGGRISSKKAITPTSPTAHSRREDPRPEDDTADPTDEKAWLEDGSLAEDLKERIQSEQRRSEGLGYLVIDMKAFVEILKMPDPCEKLRTYRGSYIKLYIGAAALFGVLIQSRSSAELAKAVHEVLSQPFLVHFYPPLSWSAVYGILPFVQVGEAFSTSAEVSFALQLYREYGQDLRFLVKSKVVKEMLIKKYDIPEYLFIS